MQTLESLKPVETVRSAESPRASMSLAGKNLPVRALGFILLAVAATAFGAYWRILNIGFLLDDFSHLDYVYLATHGDWSSLARVFTGNWTGSADHLTSYRPLISISFCLDYILWGVKPFGYHLTNLAMFALCSILTSLLTYKLSEAVAGFRPRLMMALTAGLMFALYPLHPEAVAWVIGRVDPQCAMFYFAALYGYLVFRRSDCAWHLALALVAFGLALPSKEMSVTLPLVLTLGEFLLPGRDLGWCHFKAKKRWTCLGLFWLVLLAFAAVRTCALGTIVGGYGGGGIKEFIHSLKNFADSGTWLKVFYGVNEELPFSQLLLKMAWLALGGIAALATLRLGERITYWRTVLFLFLWAAVSELPTFQIWHVYPNLCGSRLLYIPSAPLCIALAMVALPAYCLFQKDGKAVAADALSMEATGEGRLPAGRQPAQYNFAGTSTLLQVAGAAALIILSILWYMALETNLEPWISAGLQMKTLTTEVRNIARTTPQGKVSVLLDLPQDCQGAGMIGRPQYLQKLLQPPLDSVPESDKVIALESPVAAGHEYAYPRLIERLLADNRIEAFYKWDSVAAHYLLWRRPQGAHQVDFHVQELMNVSGKVSGTSRILWLPPVRLDPFQVKALELAVKKAGDPRGVAARTGLVWRSQNQPAGFLDYSDGPCGQPLAGKVVFVPSRYRAWLYHGAITQIGLKIQSNAHENASANADVADADICVGEMRGSSDSALIPSIQIVRAAPGSDGRDQYMLNVEQGERVIARFDCSAIAGAARAIIVVTRAGVALPDLACANLLAPKQLAVHTIVNLSEGSLPLPAAALNEPGIHQVAVIAIDSGGKPAGFFSEPVCINVAAR